MVSIKVWFSQITNGDIGNITALHDCSFEPHYYNLLSDIIYRSG